MKKLTAVFAAAMGLAIWGAGSAQAAVMVCPTEISGFVTDNLGCEYSDAASQDFLNTDPITVNAEAFFDMTNWEFLTKNDSPGGDTGTFDFSTAVAGIVLDTDEVLDGIMSIFKSGNGTTLVGYLLPASATSMTWTGNPFQDPPFNVSRAISHISIYYKTRDGDGFIPMPEPAALGLFGLGLVGLGLATRRRRV